MDNNFPQSNIRVQEVRIGQVRSLDTVNALSAIRKSRINTRVMVKLSGLVGDEQADRKHHGGEEKAVHHYPSEHYNYWRSQLKRITSTIETGAFGENLSTTGLTENNVYIGDIYKIGSTILQVSQARQPCWKLNEVFSVQDMAQRVQNSLRTGWYYRVLEQGEIEAGDHIQLLDRPEPQWPLIRLLRILFENPLDYDSLNAMTGLISLADSWKRVAQNRLTHRKVENWNPRLLNNFGRINDLRVGSLLCALIYERSEGDYHNKDDIDDLAKITQMPTGNCDNHMCRT